MTYNFDPDRWYEDEYAVLVRRRDSGELDAEAFEAAVDAIHGRYEAMVGRLDGTYRLPDDPKSAFTTG